MLWVNMCCILADIVILALGFGSATLQGHDKGGITMDKFRMI